MDNTYLEYRRELAETVANEIKKQILASYDELSAEVRQPIEDRLNQIRPAANNTQQTFFKLLVIHQLKFPTFDAVRLWAWYLKKANHRQEDFTRLGVAKTEKIRRRQRRPVKGK